VLLCITATATSFDPFTEGPYKTARTTYHALLNSELSNMVDIWLPEGQADTPMLYMVGGLGGLLPGDGYDTILSRVASHGFTVVQPWMIGNNPITNYEGIWLDDVMAWVENHLKDKLEEDGIGGGVSFDHRTLFLISHSAGGHVAVEYLKHHCGDVKGQILLSPVDGFDPFGLINMFAITPGQYLNFNLPTLVLMCGLDAVSGIDWAGGLMPACAPVELSNTRFYDAMPGNAWLLNATEYGHGDTLDQFYVDAIQFTHFCAAAPPEQSRDNYRRFVAGEIVTFMSYLLAREPCDILNFMEDPALMPVPVVAMKKNSVLDNLRLWTGKMRLARGSLSPSP